MPRIYRRSVNGSTSTEPISPKTGHATLTDTPSTPRVKRSATRLQRTRSTPVYDVHLAYIRVVKTTGMSWYKQPERRGDIVQTMRKLLPHLAVTTIERVFNDYW